jgi:Ca2+-binding RTX toxin-like protein
MKVDSPVSLINPVHGGCIMATKYGWFGSNTVTGTSGSDYLFGGTPGVDLDVFGNDTLKGLSGNDTLDGGYGNDVYYGGAGADVFRAGVGHDVIKDFSFTSGDRLDLRIGPAAGIDSMEEFYAHAHNVGGNVVVDMAYGGSVTIEHASVEQFKADDFIF